MNCCRCMKLRQYAVIAPLCNGLGMATDFASPHLAITLVIGRNIKQCSSPTRKIAPQMIHEGIMARNQKNYTILRFWKFLAWKCAPQTGPL